MHKIIAILFVFISLNQVHAGNYCTKEKCFVCPKPVVKVETVKVEPQVIKQKIDQKIINKTDVVNNLVMPVRLEPLVIAPPPPQPVLLTPRPFNFQPNVGRLPQRDDPYRSPFVEAIRTEARAAVLLNNVVTRRTTTVTSSGATTTTSSAVRINPQTGEKQFIIPNDSESGETPTPPAPQTESIAPTRYGYGY